MTAFAELRSKHAAENIRDFARRTARHGWTLEAAAAVAAAYTGLYLQHYEPHGIPATPEDYAAVHAAFAEGWDEGVNA